MTINYKYQKSIVDLMTNKDKFLFYRNCHIYSLSLIQICMNKSVLKCQIYKNVDK